MRAEWLVLCLLAGSACQAQFSFQPPLSSTTLNGAVTMVTADLNGDGIADLVVSNTGSNLFTVSLGNGDGTFRQEAIVPVVQTCAMASLFAGDFTGDGKTDLLGFCLLQNQFIVYPGLGDGNFGGPITSQLPSLAFAGHIPLPGIATGISAAVADFNNDGRLDLAVVLATNLTTFPPSPTGIYFLPGLGDGTFGPAVQIPGVSQAVTLISGDFNNDGRLDLAYLAATPSSGAAKVTNYFVINQTLGILLGNGNGTFTAGPTYPWPGATFGLSAADLNGDGLLDLYSAGATQAISNQQPTSVVTVMLGQGNGNFTQVFSVPDPSAYLATGYCLGDFSGTGSLDLLEIFTNAASITSQVTNTSWGVRLGNGQGGFGAIQIFTGPPGMFPASSACTDFNGDGLPDLAFTGMIYANILSAFKGYESLSNVDAGMALLPPGQLYLALNSNPAPVRSFSIVNAASAQNEPLAADSIATAFWNGPAHVNGIGVNVQDSTGQTRAAQLFFVSPTQLNYSIPAGTALGQATVIITGAPNAFSAPLKIVSVAPGLFNAGNVALGYADTVSPSGSQEYTSISTPNASGTFQTVPIDVSGGNVYLLLFGTGIRHHLNPVTATVSTNTQTQGPFQEALGLPVAYAGAQGAFVGEDQINIALPASLAGAGSVNVTLTVDGQKSNTIQIAIR